MKISAKSVEVVIVYVATADHDDEIEKKNVR